MDRMRTFTGFFETSLGELPPWVQNIIAMAMALISHLGLFTSIIAFVVIMFQLKVVFVNGKVKDKELCLKEVELKLKLLQYEKECIPNDSDE